MRTRWKRHSVRILIALALLVFVPAAPVAGAPAVPKLDWQDCGDGVQCATAKVPLDYDKPGGRKITLALARRPATDPSQRIGSVFVNPGGPGVSAADHARNFRQGTRLGQRFDIVGVDPRGVGASRPAIRCLSDRDLDRQITEMPAPRPRNLNRFLELGAEAARGCRKRTPSWLLRHVSTADTARDMDLMRRAVGDAKLTYLGTSYGTEIGAVYASLFPKRVRALALDGAIDHRLWSRDPLAYGRAFALANERALGNFFGYCSTDPNSCPFVTDGEPGASYDTLIEALERNPVPATDGDPRPVDGTLARVATLGAMYDPDVWPLLGAGLKNARDGDGAILRAIASAVTGRGDDGRYLNDLAANVVITANDGGNRRARRVWATALRKLVAQAPHFADIQFVFDATRRHLPVSPDAYRKPLRYPKSSPTLLVVGSTRDNATPYAHAKALTRQLGNARLLTRVGDGHTGGGYPCTGTHITTYLIEGVPPAPGTTCEEP